MVPIPASSLAARLAEYGDIRLALLFGSLATGRATPDSDIDLALPSTHHRGPEVRMDRDVISAVKFRNIAVHNHDASDWDILHAIARYYLGDFKDFARTVDKWIAHQPQ